MQLREWIQQHNCTIGAFADAIEYSRPYIHTLIRGEKKPGKAAMKLIYAYTEGEVGPEDWKKLKPPKKTARRRTILGLAEKMEEKLGKRSASVS